VERVIENRKRGSALIGKMWLFVWGQAVACWLAMIAFGLDRVAYQNMLKHAHYYHGNGDIRIEERYGLP
jgi:hypothetical protein